MANLRVTSGSPTDLELAAIVIALTPVAVEEPATTGPTGWRQAGIVESHGRALVAQVGDLDRPGGW